MFSKLITFDTQCLQILLSPLSITFLFYFFFIPFQTLGEMNHNFEGLLYHPVYAFKVEGLKMVAYSIADSHYRSLSRKRNQSKDLIDFFKIILMATSVFNNYFRIRISFILAFFSRLSNYLAIFPRDD